ncbi:MAG: glycosyltransferase family 4 protein [Acidimicrobiales bacterium]|nr:glycosyltransferase family 4 protein [Acidimicrobiales bacterium]
MSFRSFQLYRRIRPFAESLAIAQPTDLSYRGVMPAAESPTPAGPDPLTLTLPVPSTRVPIGGVTMIYEFANAMARRGHRAHLHHHELFGYCFSSLDDITWFTFEPEVEHFFPGPHDHRPLLETVPDADIFFGYFPDAETPERLGLPIKLIQGWRMMGEELEINAYEAPCPKLCVARWLVDIGLELGVPANQLVHIPLGLRHDLYRLTRPIEGRRPHLGFLYSEHPQKGVATAVEVIELLRARRPDLAVSTFGAKPLPEDFPDWVTHHEDPPVADLVDGFYNQISIYLCPSVVEGFGFPAVEAMAGGAALVTTDNGGSRDYAHHDETALVGPPEDAGALAAHIEALLDDEPRRLRLARAGNELVKLFNWERSAEVLEAFLFDYRADPAAYQGTPEDHAEYRGRDLQKFA